MTYAKYVLHISWYILKDAYSTFLDLIARIT